ncbi:hypothetical protein P775_02210 [Puniceibacterium antarcticum]|uniref:PAS domain-containing protein n=1 Tax=Puniceibacterium antarcticum TaxID=1206336 RepID=A0A2G8RL42_9RHOB|nr:PAS-domain containing protein [Puniceibacterium antarcticum]PIL21808.1 hypothetical protein P775_02210 [Puniceibacterium antarcticum]
MDTLLELFLALGIGCISGLAGLVGCSILQKRSPGGRDAGTFGDAEDRIVFLMSAGRIYTASEQARQLLAGLSFEEAGWGQICSLFATVFPDLPPEEPDQPLVLKAAGMPETTLILQPIAGTLRIEVVGRTPSATDMLLYLQQGEELETLRIAMASIPSLFWESDQEGGLIWANAAYHALCEHTGVVTSEAPLFDISMSQNAEPAQVRIRLKNSPRDSPRWFEISSRQSNGRWLHHAINVDAVVNAETAQRSFVQTLTKTFAHLPIGLAVFDRNRQLALFNPALIDLTTLPAEFLSGRPNLMSFFDQMRDNRMMPEPKNYSGWREQLGELVAAASDDRYCETWSLPSGLTYKITGRPHPDGAIAFLIEDISSEISLTRRFRAEMELSQSVLDTLNQAVAVFSHLGVLTFCNAAYRELWKTDPDSALAEMTVLDATRLWQVSCEPSPIWPDLRDFVLARLDRTAWSVELTLHNGPRLKCTVEPISGGATVVRFSMVETRVVWDAPRLRLSKEA